MRSFLLLLLLSTLVGAAGGPPQQLTSRVRLESVPPGARVYGQAYAANRPSDDILGVTPCLLPVDVRFSHTFTLVREGYATEKLRLESGATEGTILRADLKPTSLQALVTDPFVKRPFLATSLVAAVVLGGVLLIAHWQLKVSGLTERAQQAALEAPELSGRLVDQYRVMEMLGEGALAQVYRVEHLEYGDQFALKWLKPSERTPQALRRFQRELALGRELVHPRLVRILAFGSCAGSPYLVMELVPGETLAARLSRGRLSRTDTLRMGIEVCQALEELHGRGLVHRDLKPENLMVSPTGIRVLDYGALKGDVGVCLTASGTALGTPLYMSPEHINARRVDHRSDLYSLGVVLYECLSGRLPFLGDDAAQVLAGHLYESPPPLVEADPELRAVVSWLMAKSPEQRPENARQTRQALERLLLAQAV